MEKKYAFLVVTLLGMFFVTAGPVLINLTNAELDMSPVAGSASAEVISFDCDGSPMTVNATEPDGDWDEGDVKSAVGSECTGAVTSIVMNGDTYKTNKYGMKSFDEDTLKADECAKDGNTWDKGACAEAVAIEP